MLFGRPVQAQSAGADGTVLASDATPSAQRVEHRLRFDAPGITTVRLRAAPARRRLQGLCRGLGRHPALRGLRGAEAVRQAARAVRLARHHVRGRGRAGAADAVRRPRRAAHAARRGGRASRGLPATGRHPHHAAQAVCAGRAARPGVRRRAAPGGRVRRRRRCRGGRSQHWGARRAGGAGAAAAARADRSFVLDGGGGEAVIYRICCAAGGTVEATCMDLADV